MKTLVAHYYDFFDRRLRNGTIIIFLIALLIVLAGTSLNKTNKINFYKQSLVRNY